MFNENFTQSARFATLGELAKTLLPAFLAPIPSKESLRRWFNAASIPRIKSNPIAERGGGPVYYSVAHVEQLLRTHTLPGTSASIRAAGANLPTDESHEPETCQCVVCCESGWSPEQETGFKNGIDDATAAALAALGKGLGL